MSEEKREREKISTVALSLGDILVPLYGVFSIKD
jgi:hypothetical protein